MKCACIYPNNQPPIICSYCREKKQMYDTIGWPSKAWQKKNKKRMDRDLLIWLRAKERAYRDTDDFIKGCLA